MLCQEAASDKVQGSTINNHQIFLPHSHCSPTPETSRCLTNTPRTAVESHTYVSRASIEDVQSRPKPDSSVEALGKHMDAAEARAPKFQRKCARRCASAMGSRRRASKRTPSHDGNQSVRGRERRAGLTRRSPSCLVGALALGRGRASPSRRKMKHARTPHPREGRAGGKSYGT